MIYSPIKYRETEGIKDFDKYYFNGMFEDFVFPDGDTMQWESVSWLQKRFMTWFNEERRRNPLTFPVESMSLLDDGKKYLDEEWADFTAEMWSKGHSFFMYRSDNVDSLSSCCFSPSTRAIARFDGAIYSKPFEELYEMQNEFNEVEAFYNGEWKSAKVIKVPINRQMYSIQTESGRRVVTTDDHIWPTNTIDKRTSLLSTEDSLVFSSGVRFDATDATEQMLYVGFKIGEYLSGKLYSMPVEAMPYLTVSGRLNEEAYSAHPWLRQCIILGACAYQSTYEDRWIEPKDNTAEEDLVALCTLQNMQVRYENKKLRIFERPEGKDYDKIVSVRPVNHDYDYVYCFEMEDTKHPYFTLANGINTHNCRLRNEIVDNQFSYTLGAGGISTGSKCVMTLNVSRVLEEHFNALGYTREELIVKPIEELEPEIVKVISSYVTDIHKYLTAFNTILEDRRKAGLLPLYDAGFVDPNRQYLTVGIQTLVEAAEYLGCKIKATDERYAKFANMVLKTIGDLNKKDRTVNCMFNTEYVPSLIRGYVKSSLIDLEILIGQQGASVIAA